MVVTWIASFCLAWLRSESALSIVTVNASQWFVCEKKTASPSKKVNKTEVKWEKGGSDGGSCTLHRCWLFALVHADGFCERLVPVWRASGVWSFTTRAAASQCNVCFEDSVVFFPQRVSKAQGSPTPVGVRLKVVAVHLSLSPSLFMGKIVKPASVKIEFLEKKGNIREVFPVALKS